MLRVKTLIQVAVALACLQTMAVAQTQAITGVPANFNRIATFEAHRNVPAGRTVSKKSVAEIVAASEDGRLLAYTDSEQKGIGLIDISKPASPKPAGFVALEGEPTSVVITHGKALVAVDASKKFFQPEGHLAVIDLRSLKVVGSCNLQGQPDSVALDKSGHNIVIAMENQRDEEFEKGTIPQLPAGNLSIMKLHAGRPDCTSLHPLAMTGLAAIAPTDPEPEFVKVNAAGLAVVTLQENNHIAIVDVAKRQVVKHFSAGTVDLKGIDRKRDGIINPADSAAGVLREPDSVAWLDNRRFVIANEGDYKGGSRSFSIMNVDGQIEFDS
ncbi:MAG: alkaline phosphatase, partial [Pseudomonadota bacterium]